MSSSNAVAETPGELFRAYQHRTKKRFGQHFLIDPSILDEIVSVADISSGEQVLEIGPGCGTLSLMLMHRGAEVTAVELDRDAAAFLEESLVPHYPFTLHQGDALRVDLGEILAQTPVPWKVVANLPYNVGTEVMFRLFEEAGRIESMTLMFQREVAQRIVAEPGDSGYGVLSLMAQLHCNVHLAMTLGPGAFVPPPKVHSSVVQLQPLEKTRIEDEKTREVFKRVVRAGFQMRRKTLANGLRSLGCEKEDVEAILEGLGLKKKIRPEKLSFQEFKSLAEALVEEGILKA